MKNFFRIIFALVKLFVFIVAFFLLLKYFLFKDTKELKISNSNTPVESTSNTEETYDVEISNYDTNTTTNDSSTINNNTNNNNNTSTKQYKELVCKNIYKFEDIAGNITYTGLFPYEEGKEFDNQTPLEKSIIELNIVLSEFEIYEEDDLKELDQELSKFEDFDGYKCTYQRRNEIIRIKCEGNMESLVKNVVEEHLQYSFDKVTTVTYENYKKVVPCTS